MNGTVHLELARTIPLYPAHFFLPHLFLGNNLLGSLSDLTSLVNLDDRLDDTDGNGLSHVTDGETAKRRVLSEGLNTHGLGRNHLDDGGITS